MSVCDSHRKTAKTLQRSHPTAKAKMLLFIIKHTHTHDGIWARIVCTENLDAFPILEQVFTSNITYTVSCALVSDFRTRKTALVPLVTGNCNKFQKEWSLWLPPLFVDLTTTVSIRTPTREILFTCFVLVLLNGLCCTIRFCCNHLCVRFIMIANADNSWLFLKYFISKSFLLLLLIKNSK